MKRRILALALSGLALNSPAYAAPRQASSCPLGFARLQHSDACVRVGGRVRAESIVRSPGTRASSGVGTHADGQVQLDIRKPTDYGPLRAFIRIGGRR